MKPETDEDIIDRISPAVEHTLSREDVQKLIRTHPPDPSHWFYTHDGLYICVFKAACSRGCVHVYVDVVVSAEAFDNWYPTSPHKALENNPIEAWNMVSGVQIRVTDRRYDLTGWHVARPDQVRGIEIDGIQTPQMRWTLDPNVHK